jgi:hypothetical protein
LGFGLGFGFGFRLGLGLDELLDRLDGQRVDGEVGGAALGPSTERTDALCGVGPDAPQADLAWLGVRVGVGVGVGVKVGVGVRAWV